MSECTKESGTCHQCQSACAHKPGWFLPGEAEKAAELVGMTFQEFFDAHLAVDWYVDDTDTFLLSPAIAGEEAGTEFPGNPHGRCVFYQEGRCTIHAAKPFECREYVHTETDSGTRHEDVAKAWEDHQDQIEELLGREPESEEYYGGSLLGLMGSSWWR